MDDDAFNDLGYDDDIDLVRNYDKTSPSALVFFLKLLDIFKFSAQDHTSNLIPQLERRCRKGFELGDLSNPLGFFWHI